MQVIILILKLHAWSLKPQLDKVSPLALSQILSPLLTPNVTQSQSNIHVWVSPRLGHRSFPTGHFFYILAPQAPAKQVPGKVDCITRATLKLQGNLSGATVSFYPGL